MSASFLNNVPKVGRIGFDLKENILSGGWKAWGGYNTVSIKREVRLPEVGLHIGHTEFELYCRADAETGNHRNFARVVEGDFSPCRRACAHVGNAVGAVGKALLHQLEESGKTRFATELNNENRPYVSGIDDISGIGVNGFGMAFDLGATYKWNDFAEML